MQTDLCPDICNDPDDYSPATEVQRIDVLHLYTPELLQELGMQGMEDKVFELVGQTNDSFLQSHAMAELRSVGIEPIPFTVTSNDHAKDILDMLAWSTDVGQMRNTMSADIVALLTTDAIDVCDGFICGQARDTMQHDTIGPQFAAYAFHITVVGDDSCMMTYSHETGHLLGLRHDQCSELGPPECGTFCFAFAFADPFAPEPFRTIMATKLPCTDAGVTSCDRIDYFSNRFAEIDEREMWQDGVSEAARVINITAPIVANFRPENDNFVNRHILSEFQGEATSNNDGATNETGEPLHGSTPNRSVWWEWTAPESGDASFSSAGSSFASVLAIYTGQTLDTLEPVTDIDTTLDAVAFEAIGNLTYFIAVDSGMEETGDVELTWNLASGSADLAASLVADREVIGVGDTIVFTATISNSGSHWATDVTLTDVLDPDLGFQFAYIPGSPFSDDCTETNGTVSCLVETFPDTGDTLNVLIGAEVQAPGTISNTVSVAAIESDPVTSNNRSLPHQVLYDQVGERLGDGLPGIGDARGKK